MPFTDEEEIAQYEKPRAFLPRGPSYSTRPAVQVSPLPGVGPTIKAAGSKRKLTQYQKAFQGAINRSRAWKAKTGGVSMTQGEVDSRRGQGGGYALPGGQAVKMGPDIQHGRYATVPDPVNPAGRLVPMGPPAFDSQVERQREAQQAPGIREGTPQTGMKITTPYGMVESTPPAAPLASPSALSPTGRPPISPSFAGAGPVPSTFGGDQRAALVNSALTQFAPGRPPISPSFAGAGPVPSTFSGNRRAALASAMPPPASAVLPPPPQAPWEARPDLIPRPWGEETRALGKSAKSWFQKQKKRLDAWNRRVNAQSLNYYQDQKRK